MSQYPLFFKSWCCGILLMLYLAAGSPQRLYQGMQNYVVIGLMKLPWSNTSYKIIHNIISIIFWRKFCLVSIREDIITNTQFQSSGTLLVISSVFVNIDFGVTRVVSLIVPYCMCSENRNECVLTIDMDVSWQ